MAYDNISVVIPTWNAARYLPPLLEALARQRPLPPKEIILVDSQSKDETPAIAARTPGVRVVPVTSFTHGKARNLGVRTASGDFVVFLTQDALPRDDGWLAALLAPFADATVAAAYSRQVPQPGANPIDRFILSERFPDGGVIRRERRDTRPLDMDDVFFSNVSSAARHALLLQYPFDETVVMCEDQQLSRDLIEAGYAVVYQPASVVIHSHSYSLPTVFRRSFDTEHARTRIFAGHRFGTSVSAGASYVGREACHILRRHAVWFPYYLLYTLARVTGAWASHAANRLPGWALRRLSLHADHWDRVPPAS